MRSNMDPVTYPLITHGEEQKDRVELINILFMLGERGGTITLASGTVFPVEPGAFWCMGPGYRNGRVVPPPPHTRDALKAWGWEI
jgi:hypothetical protein